VIGPGSRDGRGKRAAVGVADDDRRVLASPGHAEVVENGQDVAEQLGEGVALHLVRRRREAVTEQVRRDDLVPEAGKVGQLILPAVG